MYAARALIRFATGGAAAVGLACAKTSAPKDWLPTPEEAQAASYGGWIELTYREGQQDRPADGELIAVNADSVWLLNRKERLVLPTVAVKRGKLTAYEAQTGGLAGWTVGGTVATVSNGVFFVFTAPMWVIGGSLATGAQSHAPERSSPPLKWADLAPFARFPQGVPEGMDFRSLRAK